MKTPKLKAADILLINRAVKRLQKNFIKIKFPTLPETSTKDLKIYGFSDASVFNLPGKVASTRCYVIFLMVNNISYTLSWGSKKIKRVVKQILNAECIALSMCIDEAMALKQCIIQILNVDSTKMPIFVFTDSKSLWENIHSTNQSTDLKLRREVQAIPQHMEESEVNDCIWIPGSMQLADSLTKKTANPEPLLNAISTGTFCLHINN